MKKTLFNKYIIITALMAVMLILYLFNKLERYKLKPDEEKVITIKRNTQSLDALIEIQVISHTTEGNIKLSYGR